jgi:hypothetical protein
MAMKATVPLQPSEMKARAKANQVRLVQHIHSNAVKRREREVYILAGRLAAAWGTTIRG